MREWLRGRAPPCQGGGRGSESRLALFFLEELSRSYMCASGSEVEHLLAKEGVAGPNPVSRSLKADA